MNIFKYKTSKEEYTKKSELKLQNFVLLKLIILIFKVSIIILIILLLLNLYFKTPLMLTLLTIVNIIFSILFINKRTLITIKLLIKYNILNKLNKLERQIKWDNENFKIYNNKNLIINSYNEIDNLIETDNFFIINNNDKFFKKNFNILVPKNKLYKENLFDKFKNTMINNIGKNNYKKLAIHIPHYSINKYDIIKIIILVILFVIIIILYKNL